MTISVVMPAYNEEQNIVYVLRDVFGYLRSKFKTFEIIVVDDGSRDETAYLVKTFAKTHAQVKLISHMHNLGYGSALTSGFRKAKYDWVFYTDSDCQFDIRELDRVIPLTQNFDIVAGFRVLRQDPLMRIFIGHVYNLLVRLVFGLKIRDVDCSFKIYNRAVFRKIKLICKTGLIDAEVLIRAHRAGFTVTQVGVTHYPRTRGATMYEVGTRNKIFAWVRPQVIIDLLIEMQKLKASL